MTHDELLAKIHEEDSNFAFFVGARTFLADALRAVVELHKPIYEEFPNGNISIECGHCNDGCWGCQEWQNCGDDCGCKCHQAGNDYPCPTIQAIEKELK